MVPRTTTPETWARPVQPPALLVAKPRDQEEAARWICDGYRLKHPNEYDAPDRFRAALLAEWQRNRPAYVWRTYGRSGVEQVYILPARFMIAHPPFLPDYPNGYYRLDQACEADDAQSCVPPTAFFRIIPAEEVDTYQPPTVA